ncbi:MAG: hypothetical protein ACXWK7_09505 [Caulobacteraceae bacterium]
MRFAAVMTEPPAISDELIEEAVARLDIAARLEGQRRTLFLDVTLPRGADEAHGPLLPLIRAAAELHTEIQSSDELSDIEETLEAALTADDRRGIDEGCDIYRSLLASRLKDIWRSYRGAERIAGLSAAEPMPWTN